MSTVVNRRIDGSFTLDLADCTQSAASRVGGKGLGLGALMAGGFRVPSGFVVTVEAYRTCVASIQREIVAALGLAGSAAGDAEASARIIAAFEEGLLLTEVRDEIATRYAALGDDVPVAVRSSATAEDSADASFAGQQDTYLWICGIDAVVRHVVRCWASLFTTRAIGYRARLPHDAQDLAMAVVVQRMAPAEAAGVMMTLQPVSGDRSVVYIESACGLGEIVVRGEVEPDTFVVSKADLSIVSNIGSKADAYAFEAASGTVVRRPVDAAVRELPSLSEEEVRRLAELGVRIEESFGRPMDVEWAVGRVAPGGPREVFLLQARPETVWRSRLMEEPLTDTEDPLMSVTAPSTHWSTSNLGEAMPGVQTPLSWTFWAGGAERAIREAAFALGAFNAAERDVPAQVEDRFIRVFHGRVACSVDFLSTIGDRMPGTTGPSAVASLFGHVPDDVEFHPTRRRYLAIAAKFPMAFLTTPARSRAMKRDFDAWWPEAISRTAEAGEDEARALLAEAWRRHGEAMTLQSISVFGVMQPVYDQLVKVVKRAGVGDLSVLSGASGGAEMAIVSSIWDASRGLGSAEAVIAENGFHGPLEGELSSQSWREDPTPMQRMIEQYASRDDSLSPRESERRRRDARPALERDVLNALPVWQRPAARFRLRLARQLLPQRGVTKRSFLQAFDAGRAAARRLGVLHTEAGRLVDPEDVFYLTMDELLRPDLPSDVKTLIGRRRERRAHHLGLVHPTEWQGLPDAKQRMATDLDAADCDVLTGIGVSAGVVEGTARVLLTPDFTEVAPDEILVAPTTDPGWASVMFISAALVVDVGGALSHAAVVARELQIPCVVNTQIGTETLRTGDRVRVDGTNGTVEVLSRV